MFKNDVFNYIYILIYNIYTIFQNIIKYKPKRFYLNYY